MNQDDELCIITPCRHLLCKDCKGIEKCPLCDGPVKKIQKIYFKDECALCLDHKLNTISLPCGHMCMCYECAVQNSLNNFNCPMCNEPLGGYKFVFDDIFAKRTNLNEMNIEVGEKIKKELIHRSCSCSLNLNDDVFVKVSKANSCDNDFQIKQSKCFLLLGLFLSKWIWC